MSRTNYSAYLSIKRQLLEMFKTEKFENNRLPAESVLAERMGISLVTLREALLMLALEGYVTKKHGSGNYIHPSAFGYENRSVYFFDCLSSYGYETTIELQAQKEIAADAEVAEALGIAEGDTVLQNRLLYRADKKPAILSCGHIPVSLLVRDDIENMDFHTLHTLVRQYMNRDLAHALNEYYPMNIGEDLAALFGLDVGTAIVASRQVFFDVGDNPIIYNKHFFYPNIYRVKTLQNWALSD